MRTFDCEQLSLFEPDNNEYLVTNFSADDYCETKEREALEHDYRKYLKVTDKFNRQSVSYQLSKKDVLHSWLKYREGFSADLVNILLNEMQAQPGDTVMDPFFGSGTTALVCQMRGLNSIGFDIMPISAVSIKAKAAVLDYDIKELSTLLEEVRHLDVPADYDKRTPYVRITQDAYPEKTEVFLQFISDWRDSSDYSSIAKNLLTLCIINSLERCSYTSKDGQYLGWDSRSKKVINANIERERKGQKLLPKRTVRPEILDIQSTITQELEHVISDIRIIQASSEAESSANIDFRQCSVLYELPKMEGDIIKGVITSPPYCNRYDYTRTYALELVYLGLDEQGIKDMRQNLLSCTVESKPKIEELREYYESINCVERFKYIENIINENKVFREVIQALENRKDNGDLNNTGVIRMVEGYFTELVFTYAELFRICKKGGMVAFVNDNVRYGGEVIPVDFLCSNFAEQLGFKIKEIYCLRQQKGNSSQQMAKYGRVPLRKSITVWVKE